MNFLISPFVLFNSDKILHKLDTITILIDPSRNSQSPIYLLFLLPEEVVMVFEDEEAGRREEDLPNPKQHHVLASGF